MLREKDNGGRDRRVDSDPPSGMAALLIGLLLAGVAVVAVAVVWGAFAEAGAALELLRASDLPGGWYQGDGSPLSRGRWDWMVTARVALIGGAVVVMGLFGLRVACASLWSLLSDAPPGGGWEGTE